MADHLTADLHVGHRNILTHCDRPWPTVDEMNAAITSRWNTAVAPTDRVYVLGDFSLSLSALALVPSLNGEKILVAGNHDLCWDHNRKRTANTVQRYYDSGFAEVHTSGILHGHSIEGIPVVLSHLPYRGDSHHDDRYTHLRPVDEGLPVVCGHVHNTWQRMYRGDGRTQGNQVNVGVDVWDFTPVPAATVVALLRGVT